MHVDHRARWPLALLLASSLLPLACSESPGSRLQTEAGRDLDHARDLAGLEGPPREARSGDLLDARPADRTAADAGPWKLVWSDEFNVAGAPDPSRWDYEVGYVRNSELQYYTKARTENARVENGNLVIEARQDNWQGHEITSASLITLGKASWTYGRVEVRAKLPTGLGTWPAHWMLGTNIESVGWPKCGEIDIMENVGFEPDRIYGTVHWDDGGHTSKGGNTDLAADPPYKSFHLYAVEWYADRMDFFVDAKKYFTFTKPASWPFDKPQYLILNLAFGGSWGAQNGVDKGILPQQMLIDYVRVYEHVP